MPLIGQRSHLAAIAPRRTLPRSRVCKSRECGDSAVRGASKTLRFPQTDCLDGLAASRGLQNRPQSFAEEVIERPLSTLRVLCGSINRRAVVRIQSSKNRSSQPRAAVRRRGTRHSSTSGVSTIGNTSRIGRRGTINRAVALGGKTTIVRAPCESALVRMRIRRTTSVSEYSRDKSAYCA